MHLSLCCLNTLIFYAICLACIALLLVSIFVYVTSQRYPDMKRFEDEKYFFDPVKKKNVSFPSLHDPPSIDLTVIAPAYNEEDRLSLMLDDALQYLEDRQIKNPSFSYEIIVVDDGSKDKTSEVALRYSEIYGVDKFRVLTLVQNRGKGGAIRMGMFVGRGKLLLFADADGATSFRDVIKLETDIKKINVQQNNQAVVCGSRAHLETESIAQRSMFRTFLMKGFHFLVWFLCVRGINDTQCGFKLFTREAAILLFTNMHVNRWAFDCDLLYLAQYFKMPLSEVAVTWTEIPGSKLTPFWSWLQMGRDILLIRLRYMTNAWRIEDKPKSQ